MNVVFKGREYELKPLTWVIGEDHEAIAAFREAVRHHLGPATACMGEYIYSAFGHIWFSIPRGVPIALGKDIGTICVRALWLTYPEYGFHPKHMGAVAATLRAWSQQDAKPIIIVETLHPYLLDYVDLATDRVLVFPGGGKCGEAFKPASMGRWADEMKFGEYWSTVGDEGLLLNHDNDE